MSSSRFLVFASALAVACGNAAPANAPSTTAAVTPPVGFAHELVIKSAGCWLGGLWGDALGESGDARVAGIERRCNDVLKDVGELPEGTYFPLRALDAATVDKLALKVEKAAADDDNDRPHAKELSSLLRVIADASRETVHARRAADKVKEVFETPPADEHKADKVAAAPELRSSSALRTLLETQGPYASDARAIGTLHALDRMEIARGLPKHLEIYAVQGAYLEVFGVQPPTISDDAAAPIPSGTWLTYLSQVAAAAAHPVAADAKNPHNRDALAWTGVLLGFADRLRGVRGDASLEQVTRAVVARLDEQAKREQAAYEAHVPADR